MKERPLRGRRSSSSRLALDLLFAGGNEVDWAGRRGGRQADKRETAALRRDQLRQRNCFDSKHTKADKKVSNFSGIFFV